MYTFSKWFDSVSGVTLGALAAQSGINYGFNLLNFINNEGLRKYREQEYDPVVRQDLMDLLLLHRLRAYDAPFGENKREERRKYRYIFLMAVMAVLLYIFYKMQKSLYAFPAAIYLLDVLGLAAVVVMIWCLIMFKKISREQDYTNSIWGKGLSAKELDTLDKQIAPDYWSRREYCRERMAAEPDRFGPVLHLIIC